MFASLREIRRLRRGEKTLLARIAVLEGKNERLNDLLLARDFLWADRFLTNKANTWAISDEAETKVAKNSNPSPDPVFNQEQTLYLERRQREMVKDAVAAGLTESAGLAKYKQLEPDFILDFQSFNE